MKILIINGPNLNLIGIREIDLYGAKTFDEYFQEMLAAYPEVQLEYYQSNVEGELINKLHEVGFTYDGIVFNAGAYSHTSVALADAIRSITTEVVEVHITNIFSREDYRQVSLIAPVCKGIISGFGLESYKMAIEYFLTR